MADVTTTTKTTSASTTATTKKAPGLTFKRFFTTAGVSPYDELEWELRLAQITDAKGGVIFEQKDVETPKDWSMTATNIVASKYLHGTLDTPERETGVRQLVTRVAETIRDWGIKGGYFRTRRRRGHLPRRARPPAVAAEGGLQLAGMVQRGLRSHRAQLRRAELALERRGAEGRIQRRRLHQAAVLGLLHQLGQRFARLHPDAGQDRRHALQVGIGHRHEPVAAALVHRVALRRRHRLRPAELHERLRRLRRRHQVRRQDPSRRQDGHPQRRPSRRRRVHRVQAEGRGQSLGARSSTATTAPVPTRKPTRPSSSRTPTTPCA